MILENLYLIVAITEKTNAIGKDNNLLYFLKEDMNFFKEKTCGNSIICGRKTFEGFKIKPLPKRKNIVLTKSDFSFEGVRRFKNIEDLINFIKENPKLVAFIVKMVAGFAAMNLGMGVANKILLGPYEYL